MRIRVVAAAILLFVIPGLARAQPEASAVPSLTVGAGWAGFADGMLACIDPRVARLKHKIRPGERTILAGSSMGAFVSGLASLESSISGIFLIALPLEIPGYSRAFDAARVTTTVVHGWNDEICPASEVVTFARQRRSSLLMLPDTHRLADHVDLIAEHFRLFLTAIEAEPDLAALAEVEE